MIEKLIRDYVREAELINHVRYTDAAWERLRKLVEDVYRLASEDARGIVSEEFAKLHKG